MKQKWNYMPLDMSFNKVLKLVLDIQSVILEVEMVIDLHEKDYFKFSANFMAVRTVERNLEIIGEAVKKLKTIDPTIAITNYKHIIGLRNMIVHAYDAIDPTTLWKIIIKDLPLLKEEIQKIRA